MAPPFTTIVVPTSKATATVVATEVDDSVSLEDFVAKVTKVIPAPLLEKQHRHRALILSLLTRLLV
jgi:thiamine phosphate synthase YjbQ (UPF0047 family)